MTMVYSYIFSLAILLLVGTSPLHLGVGEVSTHIYIQ